MTDKKLEKGNRNLIILGLGALLVTAITTGTSLMIYRTSGDIYLDRSRPGYLPDKSETVEDTDVDMSFTFSETGNLDADELAEYLQELKKLKDGLQKFDNAYSPTPLSDSSLGIPSEFKEN